MNFKDRLVTMKGRGSSMKKTDRSNKVLIGIVIAVMLIAVASYIFYLTREDNAVNQADEKASSENTSPKEQANKSSSYRDGTYEATGDYRSPGGREEIKLSVTVNDGIIINTNATTAAASGTSRQYQREFVNNYKTLVVGKNINEVELDRVAGSSLTSNGFNDALEQIKQKAGV